MNAMTVGALTHIGRVRTENQDAYLITPTPAAGLDTPKGILLVVADGMGGHRAGRQASQLAVSVLESAFTSAPDGGGTDVLLSAFHAANERIVSEGEANVRYRGMGTTCSALLLQGSSAWTCHIGDSKIFLASHREIMQMTTDHSRVWELFKKGVITREQLRVHPERNLLTRVLGMRGNIEPDITGPHQLTPGTRFVLCSDGLTNHVQDEEIRAAVMDHAPQEAAEVLVALANERGGTDNITVVVVGIDDKA